MEEQITNNQPEPKKGIFSKKMSVLISILLMVVVFIGGVILGDSRVFTGSQWLIEGADKNASSTPGVLTGKDGEIPEYLTKDLDFNLFWDTWNLVREKYYETDVPETQLFYGALSGMVASLGDPYSFFMTPENSEDFQDDIAGKFEGIGTEIGIKNDRLTVVSPLPDSPAIIAGLRPGDIIVKIDDFDTTGVSLNEAVKRIRGDKGTTVVLSVYREKTDEIKEIPIVRDTIKVKSLTWELLDNDIMHIKVRQFNGDTMPLLNNAIVDISQNGNIKGIILDLRNNPGGYLGTAIDMSSEWVDDELVVYEQLRTGQKKEHFSTKTPRLDDYKTVILVNSGSASASEIVAGALKDWDKATIVGETTFGKGSVQELAYLSDGSSVKLTIAKWFTPHGTSIHDNGIEPDIAVELTNDDYNGNLDPQLDKAIAVILE